MRVEGGGRYIEVSGGEHGEFWVRGVERVLYKKGLADEYDDLMAEEEGEVQDILYPQGFIDVARILYGNCKYTKIINQ